MSALSSSSASSHCSCPCFAVLLFIATDAAAWQPFLGRGEAPVGANADGSQIRMCRVIVSGKRNRDGLGCYASCRRRRELLVVLLWTFTAART